MKARDNNEKDYHIGYFVISFLLIFIVMILILFFVEKEVRTTRIEELQQEEIRVVKAEKDFLGRELSLVLSDLHYLRHMYENEMLYTSNTSHIAENWNEFSTQRRIYDQIRYIDISGDEIIRINLGENGGYIVSENDLKNKKERYYFKETIKLKEGSVYVSPLDLNTENDIIEMPYKPMIRLCTPVYDDGGTIKGIIVLNYLAEYMLTDFRKLADNGEGEIVLLNADGYRLSSSDPVNDWNFMFADKSGITFDKEFSDEWPLILKGDSQFTTDIGMITTTPVDLNSKFNTIKLSSTDQVLVLGDKEWYVVAFFERNPVNNAYFYDNDWRLLVSVLKSNTLVLLLILIISGFIGYLVYLNRKSYSKIKYFSEFDPLTKALNRRAGISKLNDLFPIDERRHFIVSLCFIDINGLKEVNDTLGHKLGDELIVTVSNVIKETIREQDFHIRLGGDEFLIVFNGIGLEIAETIWKRIVLKYTQINQEEDRRYNISVSHGIVDFDNVQITRLDDLINAADEKMYHEKQIIKVGLSVIK